jgi:hypothetical protein
MKPLNIKKSFFLQVIEVAPNFDGSGKLVSVVPIPTKSVTSAAFCGPDLDDLVVTSARLGSDGQLDENAGAVFRARGLGQGGRAVRGLQPPDCAEHFATMKSAI